MDEATLIANIDRFLQYWRFDPCQTTIKQKRKLLNKVISNLENDMYHVEYCMEYATDKQVLEDYLNRIQTDKQTIIEIKMYMSCLPSIKNSLFKKKRNI